MRSRWLPSNSDDLPIGLAQQVSDMMQMRCETAWQKAETIALAGGLSYYTQSCRAWRVEGQVLNARAVPVAKIYWGMGAAVQPGLPHLRTGSAASISISATCRVSACLVPAERQRHGSVFRARTRGRRWQRRSASDPGQQQWRGFTKNVGCQPPNAVRCCIRRACLASWHSQVACADNTQEFTMASNLQPLYEAALQTHRCHCRFTVHAEAAGITKMRQDAQNFGGMPKLATEGSGSCSLSGPPVSYKGSESNFKLMLPIILTRSCNTNFYSGSRSLIASRYLGNCRAVHCFHGCVA